MHALRINKTPLFRTITFRSFATAASPNTEEYTSTPQYPPILDLSYDKVLERKKQAKYEAIKSVKTVEEKQIKLNMPKYYGFKTYLLKEEQIPYNNLKLAQHATRTHLSPKRALPEYYNDLTLDEAVFTETKADIEEAVLCELDGYKRFHDLSEIELSKSERDDLISKTITRQVNRILLNALSGHHTHLQRVQVDLDARIEAYWYAGGMFPPDNIRRYREGQEWQKHKVDEPTDRLFCYLGTGNVALRTDAPLRPVVPYGESENEDLEVPHFEYDPRCVGIATEHRHMANTPGFWPGDPNNLGLISFHKRGHHLNRHYNDKIDDREAIDRQGILASYAWLHSQANFLGFTTFNDITYPLVTQTVITNGQLWSFYVYQLNTMALYGRNYVENPKRNICWATNELKLFEEINDGKLVGFNDEVVHTLAKLYVNGPEGRLGVNMSPYLGQEEKLAAEYGDGERRNWLEREYKFLTSNRPRKHLEYEVYAWEKIYKIDNKMRFMDKKLRPFELNKKPSDRRLDDRKPAYVPRVLRPDLPRHKGRNAKEFFP